MEADRKSESFRPGSVTSSELSDSSSLGKKSSAPKIVAVIIVSLAIVAVLVGVTVYLIDAEKAKQKIERKERIVEGIETEIDFGENAKAYIDEFIIGRVEGFFKVERTANGIQPGGGYIQRFNVG